MASEKVAVYCRLSEEDKDKFFKTDESESIQNQKSMLTEYAFEQGWEIYKVYTDDDYTGANRERPGFKSLINDAENKKFSIILCKTQSRFTREMELVEKYIHGLFPIWGIRFISIVDNADTNNKGNKKSRQINGLINEWYLEDMSENIKSVLTNKRKNGCHIGSFALYGYKKDPNHKGRIIIDPEAAEVVREVFSLFAAGYGKTAIARILNSRGIPNPTEYKRRQGLKYKQPKGPAGSLWKYFSISNMLSNEIYIGNMVQGKYGSVSYKTKKNRPRPKSQWYIVKGTHEPIIDMDLWNRVQNILKERSRPFKSGRIGIFAGKASCIGCGCVMRSLKTHGKHYLMCPTHHVAPFACQGAFISVESLETAVIKELNKLSENLIDREVLKNSVTFFSDYSKRTETAQLEILKQKKNIDIYSKSLCDIYIDKSSGVISPEDFESISKELIVKRKTAERVIDENEKILSSIKASNKNNSDIIDEYLNPSFLTREMAEEFIDYITVGKRIQNTNEVPVEIYWNF